MKLRNQSCQLILGHYSIYTLSGVKLNGEAKDLPKGIYIVNGKKVVKK